MSVYYLTSSLLCSCINWNFDFDL